MEVASNLAGGLVVINIVGEDRDITFSQNYACEDCGISIEELTPRMFSFNNPFGACPTCTGLGSRRKVDPALIVPDPVSYTHLPHHLRPPRRVRTHDAAGFLSG